jgi:hypothetical protein
MQFEDRSVIAGVSTRESDGALVTDARVARTGVQLYLGSEVDPENDHGMRGRSVVRIYRPGSEVFSEDTLRSAAHRPVTNDHPPSKTVNAENWRQYAVGNTADEVSAQGIYVRVPLLVSDAQAIADIQNGKREMSAGYTSELDWTAGKTEGGESYDAVQRNIRFNHFAIVQRGRAGSSVRLGDEAIAWGASPVTDGDTEGDTMDKPLKTVTVDGLSIEVTDQGAQVIAKLQTTISEMAASSKKVLADHATALADRDATIAKRDSDIAELKKQVLDAAGVDKLVAERADGIARVKLVAADVKPEGLSLPQMRREAVRLRLGDEAVKDKSEAYIDARFDILAEEAAKAAGGRDTFREAARGAAPANDANPAAAAYAQMVKDTSEAHLRKAN